MLFDNLLAEFLIVLASKMFSASFRLLQCGALHKLACPLRMERGFAGLIAECQGDCRRSEGSSSAAHIYSIVVEPVSGNQSYHRQPEDLMSALAAMQLARAGLG